MDRDKIGAIIIVRHKGRIYDHYGILDGKGNCIHVNKRLGVITCDPLDKVLRNAKKVTYLQDDPDTRWRNYEQAKALIGKNGTVEDKGDRKAQMRKKIESRGYEILLNVGDDPGDFKDNHYTYAIKLPYLY